MIRHLLTASAKKVLRREIFIDQGSVNQRRKGVISRPRGVETLHPKKKKEI